MIALFSVIAIFIAWIWVDYFRLIDVYEKEKLIYFIITFVLGGSSVMVVLTLHELLVVPTGAVLTGNFLNDFLYSTLAIGAIEETAKLIPFLFALLLYKKEINEPLDYLVFICISALGFSAVENVLYFKTHGAELINGRAILSTVGHMFDTALIAYGIILYKYHPKKYSWWIMVLFFAFAALSHGFYDVWLLYEGTRNWGFLITIVYFLFTISWFAVILNNALNNSPFFTYKKIINSGLVVKRMLLYYVAVFGIALFTVSYYSGIQSALVNFMMSIATTAFVVIVTCFRMSRFELIKGRWERLQLQLPFALESATTGKGFTFKIRGDSYNEASINRFFHEYFYLQPLSENDSYLGKTKLAYIEKKLFLKGTTTYYLARVYLSNNLNSEYEYVMLKPKTQGTMFKRDFIPIVGVMKRVMGPKGKYSFVEWAMAKERTE
jgi:RsiW-degrading membrane proteinase PrsW (M82 family)